jgi:hypothetical protein
MEARDARERRHRPGGLLRLLRSSLVLVLVGLWLYPWSIRLKTPNVVLDDVARIVELQTFPLRVLLFRPFNEHLAPWFEIVSAVTWELSGRKLEHAPLAFSLVSYVPFLGCLAILWRLVRRELCSTTAAWMAVTLFATSPIYAECVYWYSASSFTWALIFTLAGLWYAGKARDVRSPWNRHLIPAAFFSALAPMASAIGLLAGLLGAIRVGVTRPGRRFPRVDPRCVWPLAGTALYLALASLFRYQDVVSRSIQVNGNLGAALVQACAAPSFLLLRGFFGVLEPRRLLSPQPWA